MTEIYSKGLSRKKYLLLLEEGFTVVCMMLYSGAFIGLLSGSISSSCELTAPQPTPDTKTIRLLFLLTYMAFLGLIFLRWKRVLYLVSRHITLLLLVGLTLISCLWSVDFSTTFNRSIALIGTTFFGIYLGSRYPLQKQILLLGWTFGFIILLSTIFALAFPSIGIMCAPHEGAWRGIYSHKNTLGKVMEPGVIIFLLLIKFRRFRLLSWLGLSSSLSLIVFSTSKSALVIVIALLILLPIYQSLRLRENILAPVILSIAIFLTCSFLLVFFHAEFIAGHLGKDLTLSGRTELWKMCLRMFQNRIFLGYGFQSFWQDLNEPGAYVRRAVGWETPHSHNGLLELGLDLGLLGIFVFLVGFLINLVRAFIWVRLTKSSASFWPLMYLSFLFFANITEVTLLDRNSIFWVLYVAISLNISIPPEQETIAVNKINYSSNEFTEKNINFITPDLKGLDY